MLRSPPSAETEQELVNTPVLLCPTLPELSAPWLGYLLRLAALGTPPPAEGGWLNH